MLSERVMEWTQQWKLEGLLEGIEQGREEGKEEWMEKGSLQTKQITARNLLVEGLAVDLIARATGLSVAEVEALRSS